MIQIILWILFYLVGWIIVIALLKLIGFDIKAEVCHRANQVFVVPAVIFSWVTVMVVIVCIILVHLWKAIAYIAILIDQLLGSYK